MGLINKPHTHTAGTLAEASKVNTNDETIYGEFNGEISDANISASAAIAQSKIVNLSGDLAARLLLAGGELSGALKIKLATPYLRLTGTEGSAKDWRIVESAGSVSLDENTGTEALPAWTTRYTFTGVTPLAASDVATKSYVDTFGSGLAVGETIKTDGDFSTASGSFVDVTGLTVTATTGARRARVSAILSASAGLQGSAAEIDLQVDDVSVLGSAGVSRVSTSGTTAPNGNASFSFLTPVLTAGAHIFKIRLRGTGGATAILNASTAMQAVLQVEELSR